jgi:hypothetical protein
MALLQSFLRGRVIYNIYNIVDAIEIDIVLDVPLQVSLSVAHRTFLSPLLELRKRLAPSPSLQRTTSIDSYDRTNNG